MDAIIRHLPPAAVIRLADQVDCLPGQVVSKTLVQNAAVGVTLFAFDAGEAISTHEAGGDALVTALDGTGEVTLAGVKHTLRAGDSLLMPALTPHSVQAITPFKMLLTVVFP